MRRWIACAPRCRNCKPSISPAIDLNVVMDRTTTVRASVADIEVTLMISVILVILVVFAFLRTFRATVIPSIAVPLSLIGTFGVMYLLGYSLDNLSLMALAISTGFVVDDAIVVLENITRYIEEGMTPVQAAYRGAKEIGFTVLSMSISLVAVFIPILLMGGIVGRLFREFAVTLSIAIAVSLLVSLTTTPMMCAKFLRPIEEKKHGRFYRASEWFLNRLLKGYDAQLALGIAAPSSDAAGHDRHGLFERLSVHHRPQGIFSAAGYRADRWLGAGGAGHFLCGDEDKDDSIRRHRS